jgi:membrane protease subunit HflK
MSWNQGGGGPWGGGNQGGGNNPWGNRGNGGGQPEGPDIDEMIRRSQEKLRSAMGAGGPKGTALVIVLVLIGLLALQGVAHGHLLGFYRINDGEVAVVQRFGAMVRQEQPGLRWLVPMVERYTAVSTSQINRVELGFSSQQAAAGQRQGRDSAGERESLMMLTGDSNIVDMELTVQWRVSDPVKFLFNMRKPDETLRVAAESVMREVMGQNQIMSAIGSGREAIRQDVEKRLRELMTSYDSGISVDSVQLQRMEAPGPVIDAFINAQNAQQQANQAVNVAEGYRSRILPEARAEANRMLEEARAYKAQVVAGAQGDADRFTQVFNAYRQAETQTATRLYLETMEQVLGGANKIILEGNGAERVMPYLPLDSLRRPAPLASAPATASAPPAN